MATTNKAKESGQRVGGMGQEQDAISMLTQDHENVRALFEKYDQLSDRSRASKKKIATQICLELTKHSTVEEEIFYPAVRASADDAEDLVDEAIVEHASAKELIAQILSMAPDEDLYDAKVKVLWEQIEHHVEEEEEQMFPKAQEAKLDLVALGEAIEARKAEVTLPVSQ
ncbi:MAG: hemerythrin domain-containing protein [Massilia sp.]